MFSFQRSGTAVSKMADKKRGNRHCCYGRCKYDERYPEKNEEVVFFPFSKPKRRLEECKIWIKACGRPHEQLNPEAITKNLSSSSAPRRKWQACFASQGRLEDVAFSVTYSKNILINLFQTFKALSKGTAAVRCFAHHQAVGKPSLLSSSIVKSYLGLWSPAWHTANAAHFRSPVQPTTPLVDQIRTKVRYSRNRGKPQTVHAVPERFYRLNWGIWIRTRAGRGKRLWKKTEDRKHRLRQHVFCNKTQSKLLDKMVTEFWRRPKYWVDDPYEPYHKRENFDLYFPKKSKPFFP